MLKRSIGSSTRKIALAFCGALSALGLGPAAQASPTIVTFDYPGAQRTYVAGIDNSGKITGFYFLGANSHGFLRKVNGQLVSFDPAGAAFTNTSAIWGGEIAGFYDTGDNNLHGFLRHANGTFDVFDPPQSVTTAATSTAGGWVAGSYLISTGFSHGLLRDLSNTLTTFDIGGTGTTSVGGVNSSGVTVGRYVANSVAHGYERDALGTVTFFDPPGVGDTTATAISNNGTIVGDHGNKAYIRHPNGMIHFFHVSGAAHSTAPASISPSGHLIAGYAVYGGIQHGFVRDAVGTITTVDPPGSTATSPAAVNNAGEIAGTFTDSAGIHGFLRTP